MTQQIDYGVPHYQYQKAVHLLRLGYTCVEAAEVLHIEVKTIEQYRLRSRLRRPHWQGQPCPLCSAVSVV